MFRSALRNALLSLLFAGSALHAQNVESPLVPRGQLYFRTTPSSLHIAGFHGGPDGVPGLGAAFSIPELASDEVPVLSALQERIAEMTGSASSPFRVGGTTGHFSANEQVFPLRLDYGLADRITLGATLPLVRKRVGTLLRYAPEGGEIGGSPRTTEPAAVDAFLFGAQSALTQLQGSVDASCATNGESSAICQGGRALIGDSEAFVVALDEAYSEAAFPLEESATATQIAGRWTQLRSEMAGWGVAPPDALPFASAPLTDAAFRTLLADLWGEEGFPFETPEAFMKMGDVELHVAVRLLDITPPPRTPGALAVPEGIRLQSAVQGTIRFPTGQPDSLRLIAPTHPPRGTGGFELRWITDLLHPNGFALLGVVEAGFNQSREMTLLAPDALNPFTIGHTHARVDWLPGNHLRIALTPRKYLGPALSIGGGWHFVHRGADTFTPLEALDYEITAPEEGSSTHSLSLELRYAAMEGLQVGRPFELLLRGTRSIGGSGPWALKEERVEAGLRFLLRR